MPAKPTNSALEKRVRELEEKLSALGHNGDRNGPFGLTHQHLESILNNTNLPIYLKDADYRYILVNREYERLAQVNNEQIKGKDDFAIFPEPVARLFRDQDMEVVRRRSLVEFEETIPLPDGIHTFLTAKFPMIDDQGAITAVGGVCTDITSHKKAEALFRRTFDQSPIGAAMVGLDFRFLRVNEELCKITGYSAEELLKLRFTDITYTDDLEEDIQFALDLGEGKIDQYQINKRYIKKNGGITWVRLSVRLIRDEDQAPLFYLPMIEDINDRIKAEEELQLAHAKLEKRVADRTSQLNQRTERLAETNVALKVLLDRRDEDKKELENQVMFNIEKLIMPHLDKLKILCEGEEQESLVRIIQADLKTITATFTNTHSTTLGKLTPTQIQIADLIKQGKSTKEIASLLNLSPSTIACHRQEIRKRLSLTNRKVNLHSALNTN